MKAILSLALLLCGPIVSAHAQSAQVKVLDEKNGFRDLKFGSPVGQLQGAVLVKEQGQIAAYSRPSDALKIGEATISAIYYVYYKGRLMSVRLFCTDANNGRTMMDGFVMQYGPGYQRNKYIESYSWSGELVSMTYEQDASGKSLLEMESKPIADERLADHFKDAEKAKSDL